jgi:acetoin:2,6-dichlorophenolindophenol oxidoreductase subunit beta
MRELTFVEALREAIREEMRKDSRVLLIGEEVGRGYGGVFGVSKGLLAEFGPGQVIDTPIAENTIMGCGIGTAMMGMKPIVELMFADFVSVCFDGIINQAAKIPFMSRGQYGMNLVVRLPGGGGDGMGPQHTQCLESLFMGIPGICVVSPSCPYDAKGLMKASINRGQPVIFFENRRLYRAKGPVPEEEYTVPLGRGNRVREGRDLTIVAVAYMVRVAEMAADALKREKGIEAEIIDPRSIVPLDEEMIASSLKKTGRLVILEEGAVRGGVGSEIAGIVSEKYLDYLDHPIQRIGARNIPLAASITLESATLPSEESAFRDICRFFGL